MTSVYKNEMMLVATENKKQNSFSPWDVRKPLLLKLMIANNQEVPKACYFLYNAACLLHSGKLQLAGCKSLILPCEGKVSKCIR
jgi:hypothetical protein